MAEVQTISAPIECPFCGGDNIIPVVDGDLMYSYTLCTQCSAQGPVVSWEIKGRDATLRRVIELWNNRHASNPK